MRQEKQHAMPKQSILEKPQIGQGRAGWRRKKPDHTSHPSDVTQGIPGGFQNRNKEKQTVHIVQTACMAEQ